MTYIAHIRMNDGNQQTVQEHLKQVSELSERYGAKAGMKHLAGLAGLLHDLGKNNDQFKQYIEAAVANPDDPPRKGSVDHSTAGGRLIFQRYYNNAKSVEEKLAVEWVAMSIISHHQGLRDFLTPPWGSAFLERVAEKELIEYEEAVSTFFETQVTETDFDAYFMQAKSEVTQLINIWKSNGMQEIILTFINKFIFSCLIDADRTDSRLFEENYPQEEDFIASDFFQKGYQSLLEKMAVLGQKDDAAHPINVLRSEMSVQCDEFASQPSGIYTLSIPTGGGKTLSSLRYALKHAIEHKKERIFYIVPYTTIIEQNASEVRNVLKDETHILEHHSNVIENERSHEDYDINDKKLRLAKDNWDSPIVFTTMVQFLNAFYSSGTRNVRRLHRLANAVIIFDEVQSVPVKCVSLFNEALNFLKVIGKSSLVLCTATQPALDFVKNDLKMSPNGEMIKNLDAVRENFKRVQITDQTKPGGISTQDIKQMIHEEMQSVNSILVILNTKATVRKLFEELVPDSLSIEHGYELFHLSTNMCPAHRKDILQTLKKTLAAGKRVVCVSTQLIEAGVDISFQCVFRSLAGLDSIAQAAGRCNRHGKEPVRNVYIVNPVDENLSRLKEIQIGAGITERILNEFKAHPDSLGNDLLSAQSMNMYFKSYFHTIQEEMNYPIRELGKTMFDLLNDNRDYVGAYQNKHHSHFPLVNKQPFATVEGYFNVIDNPTVSVIVPYNSEAMELIVELNGEIDIRRLGELIRKSNQFVVNLYQHEYQKLTQNNDVYPLLHGNIFAIRETAYHRHFGLDTSGDGSMVAAFV